MTNRYQTLKLLALAALPLLAWLRGRRSTPVLVIPFAAAWHRPSLASPARWPAVLAFAGLALKTAGGTADGVPAESLVSVDAIGRRRDRSDPGGRTP